MVKAYAFPLLSSVYASFIVQYTDIPSYRLDESKTSVPLQGGIFVYSRIFVQ